MLFWYRSISLQIGEYRSLSLFPPRSSHTLLFFFSCSCNGLHNHDAEYGYIDVNITFGKPLLDPIYVLYEMVFPKVVINDKTSGTVIVEDIGVS